MQKNSIEMTNGILDTVKNELKLDHYYLEGTATILVRINENTLNNPVLSQTETQ